MITCQICGREFKNKRSLYNHINKVHNSEEYYKKYINKNYIDRCPICNTKLKFIKLSKGFSATCGNITCIVESRRKSCIDKYGVDNPSKIKTIKEKKKRTTYKHYGVENPGESDEIKNKIKQTNLVKYGFESHLKNKEIQNKIKQTNLNKYGFNRAIQSDYYLNKAKSTTLFKYGFEYGFLDRDKIKQTNLNKYGFENHMLNENIKNKQKYIKNKIFIKRVLKHRPDLIYLNDTQNRVYDRNIIRVWKCIHCDTIFEDYARGTNNWLHPRCPTCNPVEYTSIENKVYNYLLTILNDGDIIRQTRQMIKPYELDLYIPHLNLGIECDGDYWHSDEVLLENRGMTYEEHKKIKHNLCKNKNITLLHFTESEINDEFEKVKDIINEYVIL